MKNIKFIVLLVLFTNTAISSTLPVNCNKEKSGNPISLDYSVTEVYDNNNLFTQGMVCHESYKDQKGEWLYPNEVERISSNNVINKIDKSKVIVGPPESMSKSKKNTIDPETMINEYGADSVRWFMLSDSPPEKDVQWSDAGVVSANKFLQKIWNLNKLTIERKEDSIEKKDNVLVIDDLIATGGTAEAAAKLIEISGGNVACFVFVINLFDLNGSDNLVKKGYKVENLIEFPGH